MRIRVEVVAPDRNGAFKLKGWRSLPSVPKTGQRVRFRKPDPPMELIVVGREPGKPKDPFHICLIYAGTSDQVRLLREAGWTSFMSDEEVGL